MALITVSGHVKNSLGAAIPNAVVTFQLVNFASSVPVVSGTNVLVPTSVIITADAAGTFSGGIQGNDTITPTNTFYQVTFAGTLVGVYNLTGATANLDTQASLTNANVSLGSVPNSFITSDNTFSGSNTFTKQIVSTAASNQLRFAGGLNDFIVNVPNPAAVRTVSFNDPGGNDSVVYAAATQTLTGKTYNTTTQIVSTLATGTPPFSITSTTLVPNLNVNVLGGVTVTGTPSVGMVPTATSTSAAAWQAPFSGSFSAITTGTNTTALLMGSGGSLGTSGTGTITATNFAGILPLASGGTGTSTGSITGTGALTFQAGGANQNITLTPSGTGSVNAPVIEGVRYADQFSGADAGAKISAAISALSATGGTVNAKALEGGQTVSSTVNLAKTSSALELGATSYSGTLASSLFTFGSPSGSANFSIVGLGKGSSVITQTGAGGGIESIDPVELINPNLRGFTLAGPGGTTSTATGLNTNQWKNGLILGVNFNGWRSHSIDIRGVNNLNNVIAFGRLSASSNAIATGRALNVQAGNGNRSLFNYYNIGGNPATGGTGYDTAVDFRGCEQCGSYGDIFDGTQFGLRVNRTAVIVAPYFDFSSPAPIALTAGVRMEANNSLVMIAPRGTFSQVLDTSIGGIDPRYVTILGLNVTAAQGYNNFLGSTAFGSPLNSATNYINFGGNGDFNYVSGATGTQNTSGVFLRPASIAPTSGTGELAVFRVGMASLNPTTAIARGAAVTLEAPIKGGVGTIDMMSTLNLQGAPTGGINNFSLYVESGVSKFGGSVITGLNLAAFSATPTFDASLGNTQKITLTANVTSSTLSNATAGETVNFIICQDATGGRTFVWPTNVLFPAGASTAIGVTANKCSTLYTVFDGTNALVLGGLNLNE